MMHRKVLALLPAMILSLTSMLVAAEPDAGVLKKSASLDRQLEGPAAGATNDKGQPADGIRQERSYGPVSDCCKAAPSVLEFDTDGKMLRAWGGPSDPGFIGGRCKAEAGCIWPNTEHGIYVDQNDNVWLSGNAAAPSGRADVSEISVSATVGSRFAPLLA